MTREPGGHWPTITRSPSNRFESRRTGGRLADAWAESRLPWLGELMLRVFAVDIMTCPRCRVPERFGEVG